MIGYSREDRDALVGWLVEGERGDFGRKDEKGSCGNGRIGWCVLWREKETMQDNHAG